MTNKTVINKSNAGFNIDNNNSTQAEITYTVIRH